VRTILRLTPFDFLRLSASSSATEIQLRRARPESSTTRHFLRRRVLTPFDDLARSGVATKIAHLRNLVRNREELLCVGWRHAEASRVQWQSFQGCTRDTSLRSACDKKGILSLRFRERSTPQLIVNTTFP
jgi:hypothetical protein